MKIEVCKFCNEDLEEGESYFCQGCLDDFPHRCQEMDDIEPGKIYKDDKLVRWKPDNNGMVGNPNGDWVKYEDYEKLESCFKLKETAYQSKINALETKFENCQKRYTKLMVEDERLKAICKRLSFLNQCELEGISSGMPKCEDWLKAFDKLDKLLKGE